MSIKLKKMLDCLESMVYITWYINEKNMFTQETTCTKLKIVVINSTMSVQKYYNLIKERSLDMLITPTLTLHHTDLEVLGKYKDLMDNKSDELMFFVEEDKLISEDEQSIFLKQDEFYKELNSMDFNSELTVTYTGFEFWVMWSGGENMMMKDKKMLMPKYLMSNYPVKLDKMKNMVMWPIFDSEKFDDKKVLLLQEAYAELLITSKIKWYQSFPYKKIMNVKQLKEVCNIDNQVVLTESILSSYLCSTAPSWS